MTLERNLYVIIRTLDSFVDIPLTEAGELLGSDDVSRCDLLFRRQGVADVKVSSVGQPTWFTLQDTQVIDGRDINVIRFNGKDLADPPADGRYAVDILLWDTNAPNGRLWATIDVEVRPAPP